MSFGTSSAATDEMLQIEDCWRRTIVAAFIMPNTESSQHVKKCRLVKMQRPWGLDQFRFLCTLPVFGCSNLRLSGTLTSCLSVPLLMTPTESCGLTIILLSSILQSKARMHSNLRRHGRCTGSPRHSLRSIAAQDSRPAVSPLPYLTVPCEALRPIRHSISPWSELKQ